ncbi:MAG TPA: TRAP transporter substrate-binding protein DctP [Clostridium sp.]|nr:TRAP transporter substrate-binding protein DctP [Clostridium sp.]
MKFSKRLKAIVAAAVVSVNMFSLVGCGSSTQDGKHQRIIRIALSQNEDHPQYKALKEFEKYVEDRTDGKFDVQIYPNELLGATVQSLELTQTGAVDLSVIGIGVLEAFNSAYTVFNLPYLMDNVEHYHAVMEDNEIMEPVYESTKDSGFVGLTWFDAGVRNMYTTKKPINTPDDLVGLKIRVQPSPTNVKMLEAFNASATPMSFGEVYTGLQQGVIDGAENNELALINNKHGEVAKYYSYTMHLMQPDILVVSTSLLDSLTPEEQQIFREAADHASVYEEKLWSDAAEACKKQAEEEMGVQFIYPDTKPFQEKMQSLYTEYRKDPNIDAMYTKIREKGDEIAAESNSTSSDSNK